MKDGKFTQAANDSDLSESSGSDRIVQISATSVDNNQSTQCDFIIVGLTESGKVIISTGDGEWSDISPKSNQNSKAHSIRPNLNQQ